MNQHLSLVSLVVADYDEAIAFFTGALDFELCEDTPLGGGKRWVVVRPWGGGSGLLLARAAGPAQVARIGDQTGGRVFLFLETGERTMSAHTSSRGRARTMHSAASRTIGSIYSRIPRYPTSLPTSYAIASPASPTTSALPRLPSRRW
jgi:catechol 2,3-dioxygenase-like lactoylglutathione lyase family enzyme